MDIQLLKKFYRHECTPDEVKEVLSWFKQEELQQAEEEALSTLWQQAEHEKNEPANWHDADKVLLNIQAQKNLHAALSGDEVQPVRRFYFSDPWKQYLKLAAALLLPLCAVWLLTQKLQSSQEPKLLTVEARPGMKKTITLADGSVVKLHSGSSISFYSDFKTNRTVSLNGEAFFEVAKDSLYPFTVRSGAIHTQALGTSFNIDYQKGDSTIHVALVTGRVKVSHQEQKGADPLAVLEPGQQLVYSKPSASYQVAPFKERIVLGWKDGVLQFEDASLPEVIHELERWYGVRVEVRDSGESAVRADWHFTASYDRQPLETVLQGISFVKKLTYTRPDSNTVLLSLGQ
ncbi:FecR family protein [Pontibacter flavimaris]|uniref:DUF4974 domain-containing protein n=1 Tax=Pontibacter flavimaris TaxID=1797110 RepID=A0A1Q5P953_9BACT|nr:FecR domain-containing protein [Pontibacter flavimaris]OKL38766.1 hypothetical protein A3841_06420 [Pontibacter flavimaris]